MLKINAFAALCLFFNISLSFAISVNEIAPVHVASDALYRVIKSVAEGIEPYASDWTDDWNYPVSRQDVEKKILSAIDELNSRVWADDLWTVYFLQALLWHYFYQLENEKGYFACDSLLKIMQRNFPQRYESFWLDGVNKIKAGRVGEGFFILDSLYVNAPVSSSFLSEYSHLSRICFVPINFGESGINDRKRYEFYFSPKEKIPVLSFWESEERDGVVSFTFTEKYNFTESFTVKYPRLYADEDEPKINVQIDENIAKDVKSTVLWEPKTAAVHPATFRIIVDRNEQKMTLFEYVLAIVYRRFDYMSEIKPPFHENGISLRGGRYNVIRGVSGESVIYTLFDSKSYGNIERFFTTKNTLLGVKPIKSRILVSLETTQKAELKAIDFYIDIVNGRAPHR